MTTVNFRRLGVVGAGVIGSGVAQLFAQTGHEVVLVDVSREQLDAARRGIARNVKLYGLLQKGGERPSDVLERLRFTDDIGELSGVEFVVENVTEDWELKRQVHEAIDRLVPTDAPVAANTSAIPITRFASVNRRPERVIGMHFMNPVPLMPLVEIIRGVHTSEATIAAAAALLRQAGRESILVNDSPGFVT